MVIDPGDLKFVLAVHRAGSLLGAARALGVDKATVIRRIDALEANLGVLVVERGARGWSLRPAGAAVVEAAAEIEAALERLRDAVASSGSAAGVVRLTAPAWFARHALIPSLAAFRELHPLVDLRLMTTNTVLDIGRREADIAIRNVRPDQGRLVTRPLGLLGSAVYASPRYLRERGAPAGPADLRGHHLLGYEQRLVMAEALSWLNDAAVPVALRTTDTLSLLDAALNGLGLAVLPCPLADPIPELARVRPLGHAIDPIFCVYPEELRDLPRLRAAVDWLAGLWQDRAGELVG